LATAGRPWSAFLNTRPIQRPSASRLRLNRKKGAAQFLGAIPSFIGHKYVSAPFCSRGTQGLSINPRSDRSVHELRRWLARKGNVISELNSHSAVQSLVNRPASSERTLIAFVVVWLIAVGRRYCAVQIQPCSGNAGCRAKAVAGGNWPAENCRARDACDGGAPHVPVQPCEHERARRFGSKLRAGIINRHPVR
jgi:hypothetical protein